MTFEIVLMGEIDHPLDQALDPALAALDRVMGRAGCILGDETGFHPRIPLQPGFKEDGALDQPGHGGKPAHGLTTLLRGLGRVEVGLGLLGHVHADGAQSHEPGLAAGGILLTR